MALILSHNEIKGNLKLFVPDRGWAQDEMRMTILEEDAKRFFSFEEISEFVSSDSFFLHDVIYELEHMNCSVVAYDMDSGCGYELRFEKNGHGEATYRVVENFSSEMMPYILDGHEMVV